MSEQEQEQSEPTVGESDHDVLVSMRDLLNELLELLRDGPKRNPALPP